MNEPITIIGTDTVVSGNLEGDEDLTIEGRVEGSISLSKTLTIEAGGVVRANINVRNAIISGVLVGNIEAQESVHLTEQGRVVGDISAPRVILVDGASFRGNIDMGDIDVEAAPQTTRTRSRAAAPARTAEESPAAEEAAPVRMRRPVPVRTPAKPAEKPAAQPAAKAAAPAARPLPQKVLNKKIPPAPKVRAVGKAKAKKKS